MLRYVLGNEQYRKVIKYYLEKFPYGNVETNDLELAVHECLGLNLDWFFDEWVYGTEMPSYKLTYSLTPGGNGKTTFSCKIEQSGVSNNFVMAVPIYLDFGQGWAYLGSASIVGNSTIEINNISLPAMPKKAALAALQDVLALKIENTKL